MYRHLSKTGQISIPKKIEKRFNLTEGYYLYIYHNKDSIIIVKQHSNNTLNQCVYRNGRVSIPSELRRLVGISCETPLEITFSDGEEKIIIKPNKQKLLKEA